MPDDPPKAGGGVERARPTSAPTSISLTLLAARNAMTTECAATISSRVEGRSPLQFGPRKACRRLDYGEGRDAERRLGGVDCVRVALGVGVAGKNGDDGGGVENHQASPHI